MSKRRRRKSKNHGSRWLFLLLCIACIGGYIFYTRSGLGAVTAGSLDNVPASASIEGDAWWDNNFAFRRQIQPKSTDTLAKLKFNHSALVSANQSLADGKDLKIVAQIDDAFDEIGFSLANPNTTNTEIVFDVAKYKNANYYLYYGSRQPSASKVLGLTTANRNSTEATIGEAVSPRIAISNTRLWHVVQPEGVKLNLQLISTYPTSSSTQLFYVESSQNKLINLDSAKLNNKNLEIDLNQIPTGTHTLYLVIVDEGKYLRSNSVQFIVSQPVYVAWTIDWEGYNVADKVLRQMSELSQKYSAPMTHFFNPRIYIDKTVPEYRRNELTNWVKLRHEKFGEEIAMHMHMQYDLVRAAGVEPITSPRWGVGSDGYDVLTLNYDYQQFSKILDWGLNMFKQKGLPVPAGYRAGGWFADLDIIKALNDKGFVYDSSGREQYTFGRQKKEGTWNLTGKTQPFRPSTTNQNSPDPAPQMNIWEMPTNGNDSYWFPTEHLIGRFYENYDTPGKLSEAPKMITYLTHPDWYDVDHPKLEALFTEISKYSYAQDKGPVVFSTMSNALKTWQSQP